MAYTIDDIAESVRYHLVLSEETDVAADTNLSELIGRLISMTTRPIFKPAQWLFCDRCSCSVDAAVLAEDGSNWTADGDFLCSTCLYPDDEEDE